VKLDTFRMTCHEGMPQLSTLELNGQRLIGVTGLRFRCIPGKPAILTIQLVADVEIEGEAEIVKTWRLLREPTQIMDGSLNQTMVRPGRPNPIQEAG